MSATNQQGYQAAALRSAPAQYARPYQRRPKGALGRAMGADAPSGDSRASAKPSRHARNLKD